MSTSNTIITESSSNESQTNVNATGTRNSPSKASSTSSSPQKTTSVISNSPTMNKSVKIGNNKEIIYEMNKNGIQSNESPKINKKLSRTNIYPSGTNLTARDAFGRIQINFLILFFFFHFISFFFNFFYLNYLRCKSFLIFFYLYLKNI